MNLVKLRLFNNATIELLFSDDEFSEEMERLGKVMTDPLSLYTTEVGSAEVIVPGRNILFLEVEDYSEEDEPENPTA